MKAASLKRKKKSTDEVKVSLLFSSQPEGARASNSPFVRTYAHIYVDSSFSEVYGSKCMKRYKMVRYGPRMMHAEEIFYRDIEIPPPL